jgi:hypothetical protein
MEVRWRFFSLEEANREEGKKHPWERPWTYGWSLMRVGALLGRLDPALLDRWYLGVGTAMHLDGRKVFLQDQAEALAVELGLPSNVVTRAQEDQTTSDEVLADHRYAVAALGAFGVPTLVFPSEGSDGPGRAVFGPVVAPAPKGEEALRLFEMVKTWTGFSHLYELKTPKGEKDLAHIAKCFEPYLRARQWQSVENPAP